MDAKTWAQTIGARKENREPLFEKEEMLNLKRSEVYRNYAREVWETGDHELAMNLQWHYGTQRNWPAEMALEEIEEEIAAFEKEYGGAYEHLCGHLSSLEIDGLDEAVDLFDWEELIAQRRKLLAELKKSG